MAVFLDEFFTRQEARAQSYDEPYRSLWRWIADAARGGKRLRPALVLLTHRHLAGPSPTAESGDVVRLAAAFELLHTAFVIHDDVIDRDLLRRGRANVEGQAIVAAIDAGAGDDRAAGYGRAAAILAGDLLISAAHRLVAGVSLPPRRREVLLDLVDDCVHRAAAGEHADVWSSMVAPADQQVVLETVANKTAAYSFGAPLQAGALMAGATADVRARLGQVGRHLGIAFQLRDDVLGVFGAEHVTGKSSTGDLREGKETLLIGHARHDPAWRDVAVLFGRPDLDADGAARLRTVIRDSGALEQVERHIADNVDAARALIAGLAVPAGLRQQLLQLSGVVGERWR
ncbi:polyprenyl synthetase family protein [Microlunatus sp. Y2014]|uniref:polyprenyl synthetase family protein n=1 Tax=Microlunatus sp. Y2014 TaxID=3418488 RepID=UPI003DA6ED50